MPVATIVLDKKKLKVFETALGAMSNFQNVVILSEGKAFEEAMEAAKELDRPVTILINRRGNFIFYALTI